MPDLVTIETCLTRDSINRTAFGATSGYMARLVAIVTRGSVRALVAVFRKVPLPVASVTTLCILLTVTGEMAQSIAFEALLTAPAVIIAAAISTASTSSRLRAFTSKVSGTTAFITNARTHFLLIFTDLSFLRIFRWCRSCY